MDDKDLSYWLARIKDCKYEPDKIHIYCEHAQQSCNKMFHSKDAEIKKLKASSLSRNQKGLKRQEFKIIANAIAYQFLLDWDNGETMRSERAEKFRIKMLKHCRKARELFDNKYNEILSTLKQELKEGK